MTSFPMRRNSQTMIVEKIAASLTAALPRWSATFLMRGGYQEEFQDLFDELEIPHVASHDAM